MVKPARAAEPSRVDPSPHATRPPSSIRATWSHLSGPWGQWSYALTWGSVAAPEFGVLGKLPSRRDGQSATSSELYEEIAQRTRRHLRDATYDLIGTGPPTWELRPGRHPRHATPARPRTLRATDDQVARWTEAATVSGLAWSTWAVAQLDLAIERRGDLSWVGILLDAQDVQNCSVIWHATRLPLRLDGMSSVVSPNVVLTICREEILRYQIRRTARLTPVPYGQDRLCEGCGSGSGSDRNHDATTPPRTTRATPVRTARPRTTRSRSRSPRKSSPR